MRNPSVKGFAFSKRQLDFFGQVSDARPLSPTKRDHANAWRSGMLKESGYTSIEASFQYFNREC